MTKRIPDHVCQQVLTDVRSGMTQAAAARKNGVSQYFVCSLLGRINYGAFPPYVLKEA